MLPASPGLLWPFVALAVALAVAFVLAVHWAGRRTGQTPAASRRAAGVAALLTAAWLALTFGAAAAGRLSFETRPPTGIILVLVVFAIVVAVGRSPLGARLATGLPLAALVGFQGFRLPLELLLHRAYEEGLMPVQMSYSGLNFDIVSGITAIVVAALLLARRAPRWLVAAWNALGTLLLAVIVAIALLSAPTPLRVFHGEPANVWVMRAPWVWLPAVMVLAAALGHLLVLRRLRADARGAAR